MLPSVLLGIGLGGFVDGIVLHQVLQWHHLLSATNGRDPGTVGGLEANVLADGLFHAAAWLFVLLGSLLAYRAWQQGRMAPPWRRHLGGLAVGWGSFNVIEGVTNHHLLTIHHVRDDAPDPLMWDLGFLVISAALVVLGLVLIRHPNRHRPTPSVDACQVD